MYRGMSLVACAALLAACSSEPTTPTARDMAGVGPSRDAAPAASGGTTIDGFSAGSITLTACGNPSWAYTQDASILGGARELYTRDAGSCHFGPSSAARLTIDATAQTATWGGANTYSSEHRMAWGTEIGQTFHFNGSPNHGKGTPLHLALSLTDKVRLDMQHVSADNPSVTITLRDANGNAWSTTPRLVVGTNLIPLSSFGITAAAAADVDGFSLSTYGVKDPGDIFTGIRVQPGDDTPPVIDSTITGTLGDGGWYTSDVAVSWTETDPESPVSSTTGCDAVNITTDTDGQSMTCSATSAGGTSSNTVTVKRDATAPTVSYSAHPDSYTVDQNVSITCSAADATNPGSGLKSSTCQDINGAAYTFAVGANHFSATALDNAGNSGGNSTSFDVVVTYDGVCALTQRWVTKAGIANSLCVKLQAAAASAARGDMSAKAGQLGAYANELSAQSGKAIPADRAAVLATLVNQL